MSKVQKVQGCTRGNGVGNSSQPALPDHYSFTIFDVKDRFYVINKLNNLCTRWGFQLERCPTTDNLHFQGWMKMKKRLRLTTCIGKFKPWHIEITNNIDAAEAYCSKENTRVDGPWEFPEKLRLIVPDRPWEIEILHILEQRPDDRTIHWFWEGEGAFGKSQFVKYLIAIRNAVVLDGKKGDILYGATEAHSNIYIFDFPRTMEGKVPYESIERLKNGFWFSPKYESKMTIRNSPHILCFANFEPERWKLSPDRWKVAELRTMCSGPH